LSTIGRIERSTTVVDLDAAIVDEADQACPAREGVADRFGKFRLLADELQLGTQPRVQVVDDRPALLLPDRTSLLGGAAADHALDRIELCNAL
jgi:hypothetical protein